jgi:hypothetical protein
MKSLSYIMCILNASFHNKVDEVFFHSTELVSSGVKSC